MSDLTFKKFLEQHHQLVDESINDKGRFKAVFISGIPGSGKSYTAKRISGAISPVMINTDRATEHLAKKKGIASDSTTWKEYFRDDSLRITGSTLFHACNSILPLFIDSTSNNSDLIIKRSKILKSLGYDVGMVFINTPIEIASKRAEDRATDAKRSVSPEFIQQAFERANESKNKFKSHFDFFTEYENKQDGMDNTVISGLFNSVQSFFNSDIENTIGQEHIEKMESEGYKYLTPEVLSEAELKQKLSGWY